MDDLAKYGLIICGLLVLFIIVTAITSPAANQGIREEMINNPQSDTTGYYLGMGQGAKLSMDDYAKIIICRNTGLSYNDITLGEPDVSSGHKSGEAFTYNYLANDKHGRIIIEQFMGKSTLYLSYDNRTIIS